MIIVLDDYHNCELQPLWDYRVVVLGHSQRTYAGCCSFARRKMMPLVH
jgi:UTP:GlnB (protein PII) uridylyltransferase